MRATIGITGGDPAGIGLEVVLKSILPVRDSARWVLFTDRATFKVVLATIHVSLRDALAQISTDHYTGLIRFVAAELQRFQFAGRRIAVAAVNPHAGEGGMFGREDIDILGPAVRQCAAEGIAV